MKIVCAALPATHPARIKMEDSFADWQLSKASLAADAKEPESVAAVVALTRQILATHSARLAIDSPELAGRLAQCGKLLPELQVWAEAEPLLHDCLSIRERVQPDDWSTFNSKSMLGEALLGQHRLVEAEPLLLYGYRGMQERRANLPAGAGIRIREALERLVRLSTAKGDATATAAWRRQLEAERA